MLILDDNQRKIAIELLYECLNSPFDKDGLNSMKRSQKYDYDRINIIGKELNPLLMRYFNGLIELTDFKSKVDSINKRNPLWGFSGIKGQMFFNVMVNTADDLAECDQELKSALVVPENEQIASSRIKTFASFIKRIGDQWVEAGNNKRGTPKQSSILFFLSYFWQIQDRNVWPVYYTHSVQTMSDLNLWQPSEELSKDYLDFKHIHEELGDIYSKETNQKYDLYMIEHVFWYKGGDNYKPPIPDESIMTAVTGPETNINAGGDQKLPESFVPPIIAVLPGIALHNPDLTEAAKRSGTSIEKAFEKYINAAFTMLGYDAKLLGQGKGRVPDGIAHAIDDNYIIIWDAKIRADGYSMGTDDRTIREYIGLQSKEQKKKGRIRNIYYLIISSGFADDYEDIIRTLKMETDVNEVILVEADAIVAMVDAKLRDPLLTSLGADGLQRLFTSSGILKAEYVRGQLM
jgi:hypothetical protein